MRRFAGSSLTLGLPPDIADFPRSRDTFEFAAAEASRASGLAISLGDAGPVRVVIDPDAFLNRPNACALTRD